MSASYDGGAYVRWVQRSLNRITGRSLAVDGKNMGPWRDVLADFKRALRITDPGLTAFQIGPTTQNQLIRLNHLSPDYVEWLQLKLNAGGEGGPAAAMAVAKAVKKFQTANPPLKADGWVGHATETALIARFGNPPGESGPPPKPAPEWLQIWHALPVQVRYARWITDMAARVGADQNMAGRLPKGGWDPVYKHFVGILGQTAKSRPKLLHRYFTMTDVDAIADAPMARVVNNPPKTAPDGGKLLDEQALRTVADRMSSTLDLYQHTLGMPMTPQEYAAQQQRFEELVFQTYQSIRSGFGHLAYLGNWGRQGFFDAKHQYILIIISTLSLSKESVYAAFRHNLPNPKSWEAPVGSWSALLGLD